MGEMLEQYSMRLSNILLEHKKYQQAFLASLPKKQLVKGFDTSFDVY
jgi:hypothetical protein